MSTELVKWSRKNWNKIPQLVRNDCLNELRAAVPTPVLQHWLNQHRAGQEIGSDDEFFHHSVGQTVRNVLRKQLTDEKLPPVVGPDGGYPKGEKVRNWDDFYMGALQELAERSTMNGVER